MVKSEAEAKTTHEALKLTLIDGNTYTATLCLKLKSEIFCYGMYIHTCGYTVYKQYYLYYIH